MDDMEFLRVALRLDRHLLFGQHVCDVNILPTTIMHMSKVLLGVCTV